VTDEEILSLYQDHGLDTEYIETDILTLRTWQRTD